MARKASDTILFVHTDAAGNEYETEEQPAIRIDLTNAEHWIVYARKDR